MKLDLHAFMATALLCLVAQGVCAAPPEKNEVEPVNAASIEQAATPQQSGAAVAARRDTDPAINGSVGEWRPMPPDATQQAAAIAAQQDTDPVLNGTASSGAPLGVIHNVPLSAAWAAYENCHWRQAFEGFAAHADEGDFQAARIALAMAKHGRVLYGQTFAVSEARKRAWAHVIERRSAERAQDIPMAGQTAEPSRRRQ